MIGLLVMFSCNKRSLYFPSCSPYTRFDGKLGLVISYRLNDEGEEHVGVKWLKPFIWRGRTVTGSNFNLLNFEVVSK